MEAWNIWLFLRINAGTAPPPPLLAFARLVADTSVPLAALCVLGLWMWGSAERRSVLLASAAGLLVAMTMNLLISLVWFHPRPFMLGLGHQLLPHPPETSFPSDHATFLWSLGLGLIVTRERRGWGCFIAALGLVTAWARVYLGIHFPVDMAGSLVVALGGASLARALLPFIEGTALPPLERWYAGLLEALHLSRTLFPRNDVTDRTRTARSE